MPRRAPTFSGLPARGQLIVNSGLVAVCPMLPRRSEYSDVMARVDRWRTAAPTRSKSLGPGGGSVIHNDLAAAARLPLRTIRQRDLQHLLLRVRAAHQATGQEKISTMRSQWRLRQRAV